MLGLPAPLRNLARAAVTLAALGRAAAQHGATAGPTAVRIACAAFRDQCAQTKFPTTEIWAI